jgi:hypothetical protein
MHTDFDRFETGMFETGMRCGTYASQLRKSVRLMLRRFGAIASVAVAAVIPTALCASDGSDVRGVFTKCENVSCHSRDEMQALRDRKRRLSHAPPSEGIKQSTITPPVVSLPAQGARQCPLTREEVGTATWSLVRTHGFAPAIPSLVLHLNDCNSYILSQRRCRMSSLQPSSPR